MVKPSAPIKNVNGLLVAALGAGVAGNIWEEIRLADPKEFQQLSLPVFSSAGKQVETDMADFNAGIGGVLTYLLAVKTLEYGVGEVSGLRCDKLKKRAHSPRG